MKKLCSCLAFLCTACFLTLAATSAVTADESANEKANDKTNTPEASLRRFLPSVLLQDEAQIRRLIIPTDDKEIAWLLRGQQAPPEVREQIREHFQQAPVKTLKAGDKVTLPGKQVVTVGAEEVGADRAVLQVEGDPIPTRLVRIKGQWLVDPRPFIAARKAAEAARKSSGKN